MAEPYENVIVVNIWMYPILRTINDLPSNKKYLLYLSLLPTLFFLSLPIYLTVYGELVDPYYS